MIKCFDTHVMSVFNLESKYKPSGDQGAAIKSLVEGINKGQKEQTLFGATGTGKTFTMANIIKETGKATLVIAHNKTLAAQLAQEFKTYFPKHAVHYFVSVSYTHLTLPTTPYV